MKHHTLRESIMLRRFVIAMSSLVLIPSGSLASTPPAFLPAAYVDTGVAITESAVVADVDRDGNPDLIVAIQNHSIGTDRHGLAAVLLGNGDGTFRDAVTYDSAGGGPFALAVADVNGDAAPDIVIDNWCGLAGPACGPGTAGVLLNHGDGTFADAVPWDLGVISQSIAIADVNGDGKPDLVAAGSLGGVSVLLGNGDGTFQRPIIAGVGTIEVRSVAVADMNRDGRLDVVATGADSSVSPTRGAVAILPGNGNGTFQPPQATYHSGVTAGGWSNAVAVADLNGDGALDVAVANYPDRRAGVLLGTGDGGLEPVVLYDSGGPFAYAVALADVNGDSTLDLIVGNLRESVGVLVGNGDGTFAPPQAFPVVAAASVVAADLNHDRRPDLAAAVTTTTVAVLLNDTCADAAPVITLSAAPAVLWPPNGKTIPVTLSGTLTVAPCAATVTSLSYAVVDEYGLVQPAGPIVPDADGAFSVSVPLQASRRGDDRDGRQYTIRVTATNSNGGIATATSVVTVPHSH